MNAVGILRHYSTRLQSGLTFTAIFVTLLYKQYIVDNCPSNEPSWYVLSLLNRFIPAYSVSCFLWVMRIDFQRLFVRVSVDIALPNLREYLNAICNI